MTTSRSDAIVSEEEISKKIQYLSLGLQVASGIVGIGAGFIYYAPGLKCAQEDTCGLWLTNLTSETTAHYTFFLSGGLDFGGINGFFSADSIPRTLKYLQEQPNRKAKIIQGAAISFLTVSQTAQLLLACIGTNAQVWQTVLTVAGGLPGALYGTVGMIESEIPFLKDKAKYYLKELNYKMFSRCYPLTDEEKLVRERTNFYFNQLQASIMKARANWKHISASALSIEITDEQKRNPLAYLFQDLVEVQPETTCDYIIKRSGQGIGLAMMTSFSIPFFLNTLHVVQKFVPYLPLQVGLTGFLNLSQIYSNIKITVGGVTSLLGLMKAAISRQPIDSFLYHLRPKTTTIMVMACMLFSAMSYSAANIIMTKDYDGPEKETLRDSAMLGIIFFHLTGLLHLYELLLGRLTRDEREKFIFKLQHEVEKLERLPLSTYIEKIEAPVSELRNDTHAVVFPKNEAHDLEKGNASHVVEVDEEDEHEKPKQSWLRSWCCFNRPKRQAHINNNNEIQKELLSSQQVNCLK